MIRTENLTKVYSGVKAVDSINVKVEKGQVCGFVGPNGAGKTTTIGMLVGLIEPTSGKCFVNDIEVSRNPLEVKRIIGYLPDGFGFYAHMTGAQNLKYFSKFYGLKDADANARIVELLGEVGLANVDKKVGAYSRGMKQRLGLARALLNDPEVIFLDEPTNGLDPEGVIQFRKVIKGQAAKGKTIFFSSHILDEVQHVCNTICIISKGRIMAQGMLEDVKKHMRKGPRFSIIVKVDKAMPKLIHPDIIDASYNDGSATIKAGSDIRDFIFDEVVRNGLRIREMKLEEETLEDVFLETVYSGGN
jgi:ABC-2 type transport system ATP-binding protein